MPSTTRAHECAICRRSFLAGETVRLFRDHPSRAAVKVCELCPATAEARGWLPAEKAGRRLRMPADPGRLELAERRDALVDRLTGQLETLEEELEQARGVREEAEAARAAHAAAHSEVERLTARLAAARGELEAVLDARRKDADEMMQLKAALSAAEQGEPSPSDGSELDRVLRAREREGDETELIGIAARAFNRSPHARAGPRSSSAWWASRSRGACWSRSRSATNPAISSSRSTSSPARPASPVRRPTSARR
jgi:hypothetical protein